VVEEAGASVIGFSASERVCAANGIIAHMGLSLAMESAHLRTQAHVHASAASSADSLADPSRGRLRPPERVGSGAGPPGLEPHRPTTLSAPSTHTQAHTNILWTCKSALLTHGKHSNILSQTLLMSKPQARH